MKPRARNTYKILAVALTAAAAGCAKPAGPDTRSEASAAPLETAPAAIDRAADPGPRDDEAKNGVVLATAVTPPPPEPAAPARPATVAARRRAKSPTLLALREELLQGGRTAALAKVAHFKPLCDKNGYPLVGNLMRKTPEAQYQPSAFCGELRKQASR